jgi:hypothetical protein
MRRLLAFETTSAVKIVVPASPAPGHCSGRPWTARTERLPFALSCFAPGEVELK